MPHLRLSQVGRFLLVPATDVSPVSTHIRFVHRFVCNSVCAMTVRLLRKLLQTAPVFSTTSFVFNTGTAANPTLSASKSELQRNFAALSPEIREICPFFAIIPQQTGPQRTDCSAGNVPAFLRRAHAQSGFKQDKANGMRSEAGDSAIAS